MKIPKELRALIESGPPAHLVTLNPDGSPQITLVWIGLDGDDIVAAHLPENRKVKNIRREPRVALSLQATTRSPMGLTEYAVVYGEATIEEGGAPELLQRLAHIYIGPGVRFPPMDNPPPGYINPDPGGQDQRGRSVDRSPCLVSAGRTNKTGLRYPRSSELPK